MKKRILLSVAAALLLVFFLIVFIKTRPSGDIDNYKNYYANDTEAANGTAVKVTFFGVSTLMFDDGKRHF